MKHSFLFLIIIISPFIVFAQQTKWQIKKQEKIARKKYLDAIAKKEEDGAIVFDKEDVFGIKLNSDGYGIFFEHGKFKTIKKNKLWWIELGERKDPKEKRIYINDAGGNPYGNSLIYGKVNNFYYLKYGKGNQVPIGGKGNKNGIAISAIYGGGISIAMMKPYYVQAVDSNNNLVDVRYHQSAYEDSLFLYRTIGGSTFGNGFNQMSFTPGLFARAAIRFDWEHFNTGITAIEAGVNVEAYAKKLEIMAYNPKNFFYFNAYVSIVLGGRKLR